MCCMSCVRNNCTTSNFKLGIRSLNFAALDLTGVCVCVSRLRPTIALNPGIALLCITYFGVPPIEQLPNDYKCYKSSKEELVTIYNDVIKDYDLEVQSDSYIIKRRMPNGLKTNNPLIIYGNNCIKIFLFSILDQ